MKYEKFLGKIGIAAACAAMASGLALQAGANASPQNINLSSGTVIPVRLNDNLNSNNAQAGDAFTAVVRPEDTGNYVGLPSGTRIDGHIRAAKAQSGKDPGVLDLSFDDVRLPDGKTYPIQGSLIGLDNKSVSKSGDGRLVAKPSHKNDRLTYVGYGAGAGLIAGILTKHTLEDTVIGGGLGYLFGSLQKGHTDARDVALKSGTELGVRLDRGFSLSDYQSAGNTDNGAYHYNDGTGNRFHRTTRQGPDTNIDRLGDGSNRNVSDVGVLVNDKNVRFESTAQPVLASGHWLVPIFPVMDAAQVKVRYDASRRTIIASGPDSTVRVSLDSSIAVVNDGAGSRRVRLEAPARRLNGTEYVSMRFLALATSSTASFDEGSRTITLTSKDNTSVDDSQR